jgi:hypothetical protein
MEDVYTSLTSENFEQRWAQIMVDIGYQNDPWFIFLHNIRAKWISAFLNHRFWAGMITTQRAESMNNFVNKFSRKKSTLADFIVHFDECGRHGRWKVNLPHYYLFYCIRVRLKMI